ncbi:MAG: serine hydrolase domain-containing protein [Pseudomonadota bacterium]
MASAAISADAPYQTLLDQAREQQDIPGISAVVTRGDTIIFSGASGVADLSTGRPMTADTVLYCGSLSKVFTATLALQLIEQGDMSLESRAAGLIDARIARQDEITVEHLITHASGLQREGDFGYWFSGDFPTATELRSYLEDTSIRARPGKKQHYSNVGYATLGLVIEAATNEPYGDALMSRILQPLGMASTTTGGPVNGVSRGYTPIGRLLPSDQRPFAGVGEPVDGRFIREYHDANAMTPAFGIQSTALDLSLLTRFLLGHGNTMVLTLDVRKAMRTRQFGGRGYGLRIDVINGARVARHGGWFAAHQSHLLIDAENDISIVVMTNSDSAAPDAIVEQLHQLTMGETR